MKKNLDRGLRGFTRINRTHQKGRIRDKYRNEMRIPVRPFPLFALIRAIRVIRGTGTNQSPLSREPIEAFDRFDYVLLGRTRIDRAKAKRNHAAKLC